MENKYIFIVFFCVLLSACHMRQQKTDRVDPLPVRVQVMTRQTTFPRHTYVGEIEEKGSVSLSASTAGQVLSLHVSRGAKVQAGQLLLTIDSTQALNARMTAEAMLRQAEDGYQRAMKLYHEGGLTEQKRMEIETQLSQARAMFASAERMVTDCRVVAPVAGVVGECRVKVGENIVPGLPLITLINMDGFVVRFSVPEAEISSIQRGDSATITIPALDSRVLSVVVTDKSLLPNKLAHTYEVTASLLEHADLLPGMMAKVQLSSDVITGYILPQNCIQMLPDGARVWIADKDTAIRRNVTIGQYVHDGVLITAGIDSLDQVITQGYQKLWQGAEITY